MLAGFVRGSGITLISIDFDKDPLRARRARERLRGSDAELVSGDVHEEVPRVLRRCAGRKVAVLQDGPKGWEGLATLLAAAVSDEVLMIAQHNPARVVSAWKRDDFGYVGRLRKRSRFTPARFKAR